MPTSKGTRPTDPPAKPHPEPPPPPPGLSPCSSPTDRSAPSFLLMLRRPILFQPPPLIPAQQFGPFSIACTALATLDDSGNAEPAVTPYFGLDARFAQTWNLTRVTIGDLASSMALAPGEQLTLEFQTSQRKTLEQSTVDSTESLSSVESTTADKEAINIMRSSSVTQGWHVDSTATLTCGYGSLSTNAGYSKNVTDANSQAINHIHDTTQHSSQNLKSLHKIEVRGVTEGIVQNRLTRKITNPYNDRCVALNVYHLLKHFSVETKLAETRYAVILRVDGIAFDADFVIRNANFLRTTLLDAALVEQLPTAIQGAQPPLQPTALNAAIDAAKRALAYLYSPPFDDRAPNLFYFPAKDAPGNKTVDPNEPRTSFTENLMDNKSQGSGGTDFAHSGFGRANDQHCSQLIEILGFFYGVIQERIADPAGGANQVNILSVSDNAVRITAALAASVSDTWNKLFPDPLKSDELRNLVDESGLTEVIRRVPGFLALVTGILQPLLDPAKVEQNALAAYAQANFVLQRLLSHLRCNRHYYVQEFLRYIADTTRRQAIIDFAVDAIGALVTSKVLPPTVQIGDFDFDRTFIDRREVIVPGLMPLSNADITQLVQELLDQGEPVVDPTPAVDEDLQVPCDGVYMEVAAGSCVLKDVPSSSQSIGTIEVKDLTISLDKIPDTA